MDKICVDLLKKYDAYYMKDNPFQSRTRLLQSIWREQKNYPKGRLGNYLERKFAIETASNFLTERIREIVRKEVENCKKEDKKIQEPRIWDNLLSSQPMVFNLFGELSLDLDLCTRLFTRIFPDIGAVTEVVFEYSPGRGADKGAKYTADGTAFDVFIKYVSRNERPGFIGIEAKYHENSKSTTYSHKRSYDRIIAETNMFREDCIEWLKKESLQQIWRDHLLSLSMYRTNQEYSSGKFVLLYPNGNQEWVVVLDKYIKTLTSKDNSVNGFYAITLELVIKILKEISKADWIVDFEDRYLNFAKIPGISEKDN